MNRLNRKVTEDDLRDKGFPFECDNCGNKPTPQDVIACEGLCNLCGDSIIAFTVDTAAFIQDLQTKLTLVEAENKALRAERDEDDRRKSLANEIRKTLKTRGLWAPSEPCDLIPAVGQVADRLAQAEATLKEFDTLARRYHSGYDPHMQEVLGMKEPESPLQALEEVLDEKADIDLAG